MFMFMLAFNAVLPLVITMGIGYIMRLIGLMTEKRTLFFNSLVFKFFLPVMLFYEIATLDHATSISLDYFLWAGIAVCLLFLTLYILVPIFFEDKRQIPVIIQGIFRSNFVIFGVPITAGIYGDDGVGMTVLLIVLIAPLFNVLASFVLSKFTNEKNEIIPLLWNIGTNPLIISSLLGAMYYFIGVNFPDWLDFTLYQIGEIASPLALITLGAFFRFKSALKNIRVLGLIVVSRLVFVPVVFIGLSILLGFRNETLVALMAVFAAPTAVSSFIMAQSAGADADLAGETIVFTTVFSVVTIFIWIVVLSGLGYI